MLPVFIGTSSDGVELLPGKAEGRRDSPSPWGQSMGSLVGFSRLGLAVGAQGEAKVSGSCLRDPWGGLTEPSNPCTRGWQLLVASEELQKETHPQPSPGW